jgi:hypothetical protein
MKTQIRFARIIALVPAVAVLLAGSGCSKKDHADVRAKMEDAYQGAKAAVADSWTDVKSYTFAKRREFAAEADSLTAKMDAKVQELRDDYSEKKAGASRAAAMEELKKAQAEYKQKVADLGRATADGWDRAKQEVLAAWDRLQAAYKNARAD